MKNRYDKGRMRREFWAAQNALNFVLYKSDYYDDGLETDPDKVRSALQDFVEITQEFCLLMTWLGSKLIHLKKSQKQVKSFLLLT